MEEQIESRNKSILENNQDKNISTQIINETELITEELKNIDKIKEEEQDIKIENEYNDIKETKVIEAINHKNLREKDKEKNDNTNSSAFECSICLETAKEPVVTKCGHLFCWPCIYLWNQQKKTCPNCNNPIDKKDFIPLYCKEQNSKNTDRFKIPERPKAERNSTSYEGERNSSNLFSNVNFGFGFFGIPFFGLTFNSARNNHNTNNVFGTNRSNTGFTGHPLNNFLGLNNINVFPENRNMNNAVKHLIGIILILLVYIMLEY